MLKRRESLDVASMRVMAPVLSADELRGAWAALPAAAQRLNRTCSPPLPLWLHWARDPVPRRDRARRRPGC